MRIRCSAWAATFAPPVAMLMIVLGSAPRDRVPPTGFTVLLALLAATAGSTAALLIMTAADPRGGNRLAWVAGAAGGYGLLVIPASLVGMIGPAALDVVTGLALSVHVALAVALVGVGVVVAVGAPDSVARQMQLVGVGFATLGATHIWFVAATGTSLAGGLVFSLTRLVGTIVVLLGAVGLMRRRVRYLDEQCAEYVEELRLAGIRLAHTDERDHELRNGIAGLAGAADLFATQADPQSALIRSAVTSELRRLDDLLSSPAETTRSAGATTYAVAPVVQGLVTLRRNPGVEVNTDVPSDLRAVGSSSLLAQVVTNLLVNAAQHAPGSSVHIRGIRRGGQVVIEVSDSGRGLTPGTESAVFERGRGSGDGLGLYICRTLLAGQGGTIAILAAEPGRSGCTVAVTLPAAPTALRFEAPGRPFEKGHLAS